MPKRVDPQLLRQLALAEQRRASAPLIQAVFVLESEGDKRLVTPARRRAMAKRVLKDAESESGSLATRHTVFPNLGAIAVEGAPLLIRRLIARPEVLIARANKPDAVG